MNKPLFLIIRDHGDPSVGIFAQSWAIPCPFHKEDVEPEDLEVFREAAVLLYQEFNDLRVVAEYDFECQEPDLPPEIEERIQDAKDLALFGK